MNKIQIRPRFNIEVEISKGELMERFLDQIDSCKGNCEGKLLQDHVVFRIPQNKQRFWSPELSIEINETDSKSELRCMLGPKSSVWTLFATFYGLSLFIGLIGLVLGFSQWSIGMKPYGFWLVPLSIILIIAAYVIALIGQKLAYNDMVFLREKLNRSLGL